MESNLLQRYSKFAHTLFAAFAQIVFEKMPKSKIVDCGLFFRDGIQRQVGVENYARVENRKQFDEKAKG